MKSAIDFTAQWLIIAPALFVVLVIIARRNWKRDILEAVLAGLITIVLVKLAGSIFIEQRPFVVQHLQPLVAHSPDNAFPSDHLAACGLAFAFLLSRSKQMAAVALLAAAAIAYARVAAHLHWPLDVGAGFLIGVLGASLAWFAAQRAAIARITA